MRRWLSLGSKGQQEQAREEEISSIEPVVHRSLALNLLYNQFKKDKKYRILELGPAIGGNIEFFSQFRCTIQVEDLYSTLSSFDYFSPEDGFSYEAVFSYLLPYLRKARFDLILAWDLLNYLDREEFRHLIRHLSKYSRAGTLLFGLISTQKHIPETPCHFKIIDDEYLEYRFNSSILKTCPQYAKSDFDSLMPEFRVCNSFLLRNGFREYLFLYE
jgi:hypothetical protein